MILPVAAEYSTRLCEGAIRYAKEHPEVELLDLGYLQRDRSPLSTRQPPFDAGLVWLNVRDNWIQQLLRKTIPIINTSGDWPPEEVPVVAFDGVPVTETAFNHLATLNRPHLVYTGFETTGVLEMQKRESNFLAMGAAHGMQTYSFEIGRLRNTEWLNRTTRLNPKSNLQLRQFLRELPLPAAMWCEDDYMGYLVCGAAHELGIRVPEDLAVLGDGDYSICHFSHPRLSTIPAPGQIIGYEAIRQLAKCLDREVRLQPRTVLPRPPLAWRESTGGGELHGDLIQRARKLITEQACDGLTVNELMQTVPLSQRVFTLRFRDAVGRSPAEEIRRVRVEQAKYYLQTSDLTVTRIANLCGYSRHSKFSRFFKCETGLTPQAYRKQSRV